MTTERKLRDAGYLFTGDYSSDYQDGKAKMKAKAAEYRKQGYFARVLEKVYQGRVYSTVGWSVYRKPRCPACQEP